MVNTDPKFTVIISSANAQHYLDSVPIDGDEVEIARDRYGEPEIVEENF